MSRIRSVKPEFWTSEQVLECSTNARLLFLGLWNFCDDCGRHPYSAKQAKAEVFPSDPFTEKQIIALLGELETNGLICRYISGDKEYFYVTGWKHQRIDKPQPAKYPDPFADDSKNVPRVIPPDTIGEDTIGEEIAANAAPPPESSKRKKQLPEGWKPNDTGRSLALNAGLQPEVLLENFADYHRARGSVMLDWDAAFRTWIKNQIRFQKERAPNGRRTGSLAGIL